MRKFKSKDLIVGEEKEEFYLNKNMEYVKKFDGSDEPEDEEYLLEKYKERFETHRKIEIEISFDELNKKLEMKVTAESDSEDAITIFDEINLEDNPFFYKSFNSYDEFKKGFIDLIVANLFLANQLANEADTL